MKKRIGKVKSLEDGESFERSITGASTSYTGIELDVASERGKYTSELLSWCLNDFGYLSVLLLLLLFLPVVFRQVDSETVKYECECVMVRI